MRSSRSPVCRTSTACRWRCRRQARARRAIRYTTRVGWRLACRRMFGPPAGWVLLPALGSPLAHAPVLRWDLVPALNRPLSGRLFGANKTWRGVLMMNGGTVAAAELLHQVPAYRRRVPQAVA